MRLSQIHQQLTVVVPFLTLPQFARSMTYNNVTQSSRAVSISKCRWLLQARYSRLNKSHVISAPDIVKTLSLISKEAAPCMLLN